MRTRIALALLFCLGGALSACASPQPQVATVEVTRIVTQPQPVVVEVTRVVTKAVRPTRVVPILEVEEVSGGVALPVARNQHTTTLLPDGRIIFVGGSNAPDLFLSRVDIFDPVTNSFQTVTPLNTPRHGHTATLLEDGRVLIVGGYNAYQGWLTDTEIYDPSANTWTVISPPSPHGVGHTATRLSAGRVLVVGGCIGSGVCTYKVDIFDPLTDTWESAAPLASDRASHIAQLLDDGRVLIAGGGSASGLPLGGDSLLYDPTTDAWTVTGSMSVRRHSAQSVRLLDGRVLVAGGIAAGDPTNQSMAAGAEIFDPDTNAWSPAGALAHPRYGYALVLLRDGNVLAVGGASTYGTWNRNSFPHEMELYDPATNQWSMIGEIPFPRFNGVAILLPNGRVWFTGGQFLDDYLADTWVIDVE